MSPLQVRNRRRSRSSSVLLLAVGAVAGLALGTLLADRAGGLDGLLRRATGSDRPGARRRRALSAPTDANDEFDEAAEAGFAIADVDTADDRARDEIEAAHDEGFGAESGHEFAPDAGSDMRPDDAALEARVLEAFHNDPILSERAIDIGAIGTGVIELTGWVQSRSEIDHAITLARGVPDVATVVNRLSVREGGSLRETRGRRGLTFPPPAGGAQSTQPPRAD